MNKFIYIRKDKRFYPEINDLGYILVNEIKPEEFYKAMQRARIVSGDKFEDYYDYYLIGFMSEDELKLVEKPELVYQTTFSLPEEEKQKQLRIFQEAQKNEETNLHN